MAHRREPPRRRGARRRVKGRLARLRDDKDRQADPVHRQAGQERSCPGGKGRVDRRVVLQEPTTSRAFTTSSRVCS